MKKSFALLAVAISLVSLNQAFAQFIPVYQAPTVVPAPAVVGTFPEAVTVPGVAVAPGVTVVKPEIIDVKVVDFNIYDMFGNVVEVKKMMLKQMNGPFGPIFFYEPVVETAVAVEAAATTVTAAATTTTAAAATTTAAAATTTAAAATTTAIAPMATTPKQSDAPAPAAAPAPEGEASADTEFNNDQAQPESEIAK